MPLLHLDTDTKLVQYIKLAQSECGFGSEITRAPRLALIGEERENVLNIIRQGIENRPNIEKYISKIRDYDETIKSVRKSE